MDAVVASAGAVAGRAELPHQLTAAMERQLELVEGVVARERRLQRELTGHLLTPVDVLLDLLDESAAMLHQQAETLQAAGRALEESGRLVQRQAELFERTLGAARQPTDLARRAAGLERRERTGGGGRGSRKTK